MKLHTLLVAILTLSVMAIGIQTHAAEEMSESELRDKLADYFFDRYAEDFTKAINNAQLMHETAYPLSTTTVGDSCVSLMDKSLVAGPIGKSISVIFLENANRLPQLVRGGSLSKYCPQYSKMTDKEKSMVWVFILTAIAHFESTCNTKASAKGPNGTAYGYYQLHRNNEHKYDDNAGFCKKGDAGKAIDASRCTLGMLEKQFDRNNGELFSNNSYWDVLRSNGRAKKAKTIRKALQGSSLCSPQVI